MAVEEGLNPLVRSRVSRAEEIAHELEVEITGGGLRPGDWLGTKDGLRQRFGVAVATINEAVRLLEMRRYVEARPGPGGGIFVAVSSGRIRLGSFILGFRWGSASFADCMDVRDALEPLVCRDAARHSKPDDIRALKKILAGMEQRQDAPPDYLRLDWALHRRLAKLCRNAPLQGFYLLVLDSLEEVLDRVDADHLVQVHTVAGHRELVAAIAEGDEAGVEAAIRRQVPTAAD